jgi:ribosomal protein S18 acetylase RimI-like enzyme
MEIRPATAADVPGVLPMVAKTCALHEKWDPAKYSFLPHPEQRYSRWLTARADDPRSVFLVAVREDRPIAFLIAAIEDEIPIYRLRQFGFIHDLWVEEEYRHEGIARQMVMLAVERFKSIGVPQIRLDTAAPNDVARKLFTACGFRPSTTEMLLEL